MMNGKEQTYVPMAGSLEPLSPNHPAPTTIELYPRDYFHSGERKEPEGLFVGQGGVKETM